MSFRFCDASIPCQRTATGTYEMRGNHDERSAKESRTDIFMRQKRAKMVA